MAYEYLLGVVGAILVAIGAYIAYLLITTDTRALNRTKNTVKYLEELAKKNAIFKDVLHAAKAEAENASTAFKEWKKAKSAVPPKQSDIDAAKKAFDAAVKKSDNINAATKHAVKAVEAAGQAAKCAEQDVDATEAADFASEAAEAAIRDAEEGKPNSAQASAEKAMKCAKSAAFIAGRSGAPEPKPPEGEPEKEPPGGGKGTGKGQAINTAALKKYLPYIAGLILLVLLVYAASTLLGGKAPTVPGETPQPTSTPTGAAVQPTAAQPAYAEFNNGSSAWVAQYGKTTLEVSTRPDGRAHVSGKAAEDKAVVDFYACTGEKENCDALRASFLSEENMKRNDELLRSLLAGNVTK